MTSDPNSLQDRIARLEARSGIRGRAVAICRERARQAEAERDYQRRENAELHDELVATQEYGAKLAHCKGESEARIRAVLTVVQEWESADVQREVAPIMRAASTRIRRALDGDA